MSEPVEFRPISKELAVSGLPIGFETMSPAMAEMEAYSEYLLDFALPWLGTKVWEIGVGNGQYTRRLLAQGHQVLGTDIDPACLQRLEQSLGHSRSDGELALQLALVDLTQTDQIEAQRSFQADTIVCFNVLEHIENDQKALTDLRGSVAPKANLILIVPAHPILFGQMDREAGHFRRYTRKTTLGVLAGSGWETNQCRYINLVGGIGWFYHNRWRRSAGLRDEQVNRQMKSVDRWLPRISRFTDPLFGRLGGLSVLAIASASKK